MQTRSLVIAAVVASLCGACGGAGDAPGEAGEPAAESAADDVQKPLVVGGITLSAPLAELTREVPEGAAPFGVTGANGEIYYFARVEAGGVALTAASVDGSRVLWHGDAPLQIAGRKDTELLLALGAGEVSTPVELWSTATGFLGIDAEMPGMGPYPSNLEPELVRSIIAALAAVGD